MLMEKASQLLLALVESVEDSKSEILYKNLANCLAFSKYQVLYSGKQK